MNLQTSTASGAGWLGGPPSEGIQLEVGGRRLVVNREAASVAAENFPVSPDAVPGAKVATGMRVLIQEFLKFYFLDDGSLSKNINYCALVLPPSPRPVSSTPQSVSYLITKRCNMNCVHCYNDSGEAEPSELATDERLRLADYLGRWGVRVVTLTGGEPLLQRDAVPVIRALGSHRVGVKVSTNGWYVSPAFLELVDAGIVFQVNISLDGASAEIHDAFRGSVGSFQRVMSSLTALRRANIRILNLNVAVHHRNLGELFRICELARRFGVNSISLKPVLMTGRASAAPGVLLTDADVREFRLLRESLVRRFGHLVQLSGTLMGAGLPEEEEDPVNCFASRTAMFVASNGDLLPCENLSPFLEVPNLREMSPLEAWLRHPSFVRHRDLLADLLHHGKRGCSGCPALYLERRAGSLRRTRLAQTEADRGLRWEA